MDKIEKIRQEIKRLRQGIKDEKGHIALNQKVGYLFALTDIESFLDILSVEPGTSEFPETFEICLYDGRTPDSEKCTECSTTCSVRKEEPDKSLDEAAKRIAKNILGRDYLAELDEDCAIDALEDAKNFVKAGAEWQKEQMMKDAVEGEVMTNGFYPYEPRIVAPYPNCPYAFGDKVKVIVLKEEE